MNGKFLLIGALLAIMLVGTFSPFVHAVVTNTVYNLANTTEGSCSGGCKLLTTASGTADATSIVTVGKTLADFQVRPYATTAVTGTISSTTPGGYGWELSASKGVGYISQTWTLHVKTTSSVTTGTGFIWGEVWSCTTISEGTCTNIWDERLTATNIFTTTTATVRTYTASIPAQTTTNFIVLELWVHMTVATSTNGATLAITTIASSSSDLTIPDAFSNSIAQSITLASAKTNVANHPRSLTQTITDASALTHITNWKDTLSQSITIASALVKVANHPRALTGTITDTSALVKSANHIYALAESITDSASLTALISLLFFHGHSTLSCITKPALVCDYMVFFTEAPSTSSATLSMASHFISLIGTVTSSIVLSLRDTYAKMITAAITTIANFQVITTGETCTITFPIPLLCNYNRNLIQSIVTPSALVKIANHFATITSSIGIDSGFLKIANHFISLIETLTSSSLLLKQVQYGITLIETIGIGSALAVGHFVNLIETITIDSLLTVPHSFVQQITQSIGIIADVLQLNNGLPSGLIALVIIFLVVIVGLILLVLGVIKLPRHKKGKRSRNHHGIRINKPRGWKFG